MELICPSCEARYQVPGGSIGEKGRQVSCMNCGHGWHAYPPLVLGTEETGTSPARGLNWQGPEGAARPAPPTPVPAGGAVATAPAPAENEPRLAGASDGAERVAASRSEQLAEIREMLAEVQSEDRAAAAMSPDAPRAEPSPSASPSAGALPLTASNAAVAAAAVEEGPAVDPRIAQAREREVQAMIRNEEESFRGRAERVQNRPAKAKPTDVKRLERSHTRRHRRRENAKAAGSGAFLTGLLLVVMIAAVMIALYLLSPQIIERMPGSQAALTEYVATIDSLRVSLAETFSGVRDWVSSRLDRNA